MKYFLFVALSAISFSVSAANFSSPSWTDPAGITWRALSIRSSFERTEASCQNIGMNLPVTWDLLDAIQYGIFDDTVNTVFAADIARFDWMWTKGDGVGFEMVSKQGDHVIDAHDTAHYGICSSR
jgi:hypothetical protein